MFDRLRNHIILLAMSIISLVLLVAFTAIYVTTAANLRRDINEPNFRPVPTSISNGATYDDGTFRTYLAQQRSDEANRTLARLLLTLVLTGGLTLTAVYFVSRYVADRAIAPVKEAYDKQKQFIGDASHELKTPLATIDANIDAYLEGEKKPSKWITRVRSETERMTVLVNDLLTLAKLDSLDVPLNVQYFDAREVVADTIESLQPLISEKSLHISGPKKAIVTISSDKEKIRQIVTILLDNAVKYTEPSGKISLSLVQSQKATQLNVTNTHPTIDEEKLAKLFDRFYQADASHHTKGYGLGLAIAQRAVEQLNGQITVTSANDTVTFSISLPR
jgi:two-component system, OmpR family, sensor histidine kinase CiaH